MTTTLPFPEESASSRDRHRTARDTTGAGGATRARPSGSGGSAASRSRQMPRAGPLYGVVAGRRRLDQAQELAGVRQFLVQTPGAMRQKLVELVTAGGDGNRPCTDGICTMNIMRRVADHEDSVFADGAGAAGKLDRARGKRGSLASVLRKGAVGEVIEESVVRQLG